MEKWLIFFSVFKDFLKTETKSTWWSWAKDLALSLLKLMLIGSVGFAMWSCYSYLKTDTGEAVASAQMSGILLGVAAIFLLLYCLMKIIIKKCIKSRGNGYANMFELSTLLYKDLEKMKSLGASLFNKKPLLVSGAAIAATYLVFTLFQANPLKKKPEQITHKQS